MLLSAFAFLPPFMAFCKLLSQHLPFTNESQRVNESRPEAAERAVRHYHRRQPPSIPPVPRCLKLPTTRSVSRGRSG